VLVGNFVTLVDIYNKRIMQIYKITNNINGKIYIGKDTTNDQNYFGSGLLIKRAINKFGLINFTKEIIDESSDKKELCEKEKYWIKFYNSTDKSIGYNISNGGDGGDVISNNPNRKEILEKISSSMKKRVFTEEHKKNLSENHFSKTFRKGKTYEEIYGKEKSEEYKERLKLARSKYKTEKERLGDKYEKIIEKQRKRLLSDNNPMKKNKYFWYFNPLTNLEIMVIKDGIIPNGFIKGRKKNGKFTLSTRNN
jgi:hypothetical protein